jgi:4-hydroxy-3-methylbut-2-en-1-yl diphosphate synthase IspG/GcpE
MAVVRRRSHSLVWFEKAENLKLAIRALTTVETAALPFVQSTTVRIQSMTIEETDAAKSSFELLHQLVERDAESQRMSTSA